MELGSLLNAVQEESLDDLVVVRDKDGLPHSVISIEVERHEDTGRSTVWLTVEEM